jgi:hypothetical protein
MSQLEFITASHFVVARMELLTIMYVSLLVVKKTTNLIEKNRKKQNLYSSFTKINSFTLITNKSY